MKNKVQNGETLNWTNGTSADVVAGQAVAVGAQIGVAINDIADGDTGEVAMEGVFNLPKVSAAVIGQGEDVIWDVTGAAFDDNLATPATGDISGACTAWEAKGGSTTTIAVKINTGVGTVA